MSYRNHSPTGFEWGYAGSGPAQLALALLLDATNDSELSRDMYQEFKFAVVQNMPRSGWIITAHDVATWLQALRVNARPELPEEWAEAAAIGGDHDEA